MFPLKDTIPTDRLPLVTLLLLAADVAAFVLLPHGGLLALLAAVLFLELFGTNVEDAMSRPRFAALCALGGAAAVGVGLLLDPGLTVAPLAATGVSAVVLGGYIRLYPGARVLLATLVPFAFTLIEVPAWGFVAAWLAIQAVFAATGLGGPGADGGAAFLAQAAAFAAGVLTVGAFAQRRKPVPPPLSAISPAS